MNPKHDELYEEFIRATLEDLERLERERLRTNRIFGLIMLANAFLATGLLAWEGCNGV